MEFRFVLGIEAGEMEAQLPVEQRANWPVDTLISYAIEDGKVIGRMAIMSLQVVEGTWVDPEKRSTSLAYRMMKQLEAVQKQALGRTHSLALVYDEQPEVGEYLQRVGFKRFPVTLYEKSLVEEDPA